MALDTKPVPAAIRPTGRDLKILREFYTTLRAGHIGLSDGGGPFGFDIHLALLIDRLVTGYACDAVLETGCYVGDTTDYLARTYPGLPIWTCDVYEPHAEFTRARVAKHSNATVERCDGAELVGRGTARFRRPLIFLDAHGVQGDWPLRRELAAVARGVVVVHDFDIGHERFSFDTWDGTACDEHLLASVPSLPGEYFVPEPGSAWPLPCLQIGRRAGYAVMAVGFDPAPLLAEPHLSARTLKEAVSA